MVMSLVYFKYGDCNGNGETFDLGQVSMHWLNTIHNVFDDFQEDNDENSEIIFKTSKINFENLSLKIREVATCNDKLRKDIKEKLLKFSEFVKNCNQEHLYCYIS